MSSATVIARGGLNLRRSPKTGKITKTLRRGTKVTILEEETWLRVRTRNGDEGYVLADFVDLDPSAIPELPTAPEDTPPPAGGVAESGSDMCIIGRYLNTQFIGKEIRADRDFFPCLDRLNKYASDCDVEIFVTSSTREPGRSVSGAIVTPASRSNHLVGHAIDMNLKSQSGFFNSQLLKKDNLWNLPREIRAFIELVRADSELRWGGDFSKEDPVHIDDELNNRNLTLWEGKFASRT
jgi:hypothetical protein